MGKQNSASSQQIEKFITGIHRLCQDVKPLLDEDDYDDWMEVEDVTSPVGHFPTMMEMTSRSSRDSPSTTAQVQWLEIPHGPLNDAETSPTAVLPEQDDQEEQKNETQFNRASLLKKAKGVRRFDFEALERRRVCQTSPTAVSEENDQEGTHFNRANLLKKEEGVRKFDFEALERRFVCQRRASISDMRPQETCDSDPHVRLNPSINTAGTTDPPKHSRHHERHRMQHGHRQRRGSLCFEPELTKAKLPHRSKTSLNGENETSIPHVHRTRIGDNNSSNPGRHSAPGVSVKETTTEKRKIRKIHSIHHHKRNETRQSAKGGEALLHNSNSTRRGLRSTIRISLEGIETQTKDLQAKSPGEGHGVQEACHRSCATDPLANRPVTSRPKGARRRASCVGTKKIGLDEFLAAQKEHSANNL